MYIYVDNFKINYLYLKLNLASGIMLNIYNVSNNISLS